jgi:hypothetical protein
LIKAGTFILFIFLHRFSIGEGGVCVKRIPNARKSVSKFQLEGCLGFFSSNFLEALEAVERCILQNGRQQNLQDLKNMKDGWNSLSADAFGAYKDSSGPTTRDRAHSRKVMAL